MSTADSTRREFLGWLARSGLGLAVAGGVLPALLASDAEASGAGITVLTGATVIDGSGRPPRPNTALVLADGQIAAIGTLAERSLPRGATVVDLSGKYVIPGLWDMHVHTVPLDAVYPPLYVVNGVTGVREMYGYGYPVLPRMRDRIEAGEVIGPRMVIASTIVDGPYSVQGQTGAAVVTTEAEARAAVGTAKAQGADFVKVYSFLYPETFAVIADEAARQGLPFAGHVPERVSVADASDAGQRSVEHLFGMFTATSSREAEIRGRLASTPVDPANPYAWLQMARSLEREAAATQDPRRTESLFERLRHNGTWQAPTLTVLRTLSSPVTAFDPEDPRLRYLPESTKDFWRAQLVRGAPSTPEQIDEYGRFFDAALRMVGALERAGVGLIAGTDSGNAYCFPGFGLHDELELLVRAGLTPMRALQAATWDAVRYLGLEHAVGTVTAGKAADLVVLDADPLQDIRNIRRIHAVVTRGRYLSSADRTRMFAEIETAARQVPTPGTQLVGCGC